MSPSEVAEHYRRALSAEGNAEPVIFRRYTGTGTYRPRFDAEVMARVTEFRPDQLVGDIKQGDRNIIALTQDLAAAQFPMPVKITDRIVVRGKEMAIQALDDSTRRMGTALVAYEVRVRG